MGGAAISSEAVRLCKWTLRLMRGLEGLQGEIRALDAGTCVAERVRIDGANAQSPIYVIQK